jgi:rRNA-processing protein EBP2
MAFVNKKLKPGLNIQIDRPKICVNDEERLKRKLKDFYMSMEWIERLDFIVPKKLIKLNDLDEEEEEKETNNNNKDDLSSNDFKRESLFLRQAENAISMALPKLNDLDIKTKRPEDYFAEMAKSDEHMKRVKEKLLSKHAELERREKVRKLREMKKLGKQIQQEVEKKKQQNKKRLSESIKKFKKGDKDSLQIELEDAKELKKSGHSKKENNSSKDKNQRKYVFFLLSCLYMKLF